MNKKTFSQQEYDLYPWLIDVKYDSYTTDQVVSCPKYDNLSTKN